MIVQTFVSPSFTQFALRKESIQFPPLTNKHTPIAADTFLNVIICLNFLCTECILKLL